MHIQYNNYTVKCVYIYRFFIHIARYFCIKTGSGDFILPPPPTPTGNPSVHIRLPRGTSLCEKLESSSTFTPEIRVLERSHTEQHTYSDI